MNLCSLLVWSAVSVSVLVAGVPIALASSADHYDSGCRYSLSFQPRQAKLTDEQIANFERVAKVARDAGRILIFTYSVTGPRNDDLDETRADSVHAVVAHIEALGTKYRVRETADLLPDNQLYIDACER